MFLDFKINLSSILALVFPLVIIFSSFLKKLISSDKILLFPTKSINSTSPDALIVKSNKLIINSSFDIKLYVLLKDALVKPSLMIFSSFFIYLILLDFIL